MIANGTEALEHSDTREPGFFALRWVFVLLFVQMQVMLFASFAAKTPLHLLEKHDTLQLDFFDFFQGTRDWLNGVNPYERVDKFLYHRFNKPAPALLVGLPFQHMSYEAAAYTFFGLNVAILLLSLWLLCRYFRLDKNERLLFFGIAAMFLPVIFVVERGNLDGLVLGCVTLALVFSNPFMKVIGIAFSTALKLYTGLLIVTFAIGRRWKLAWMSLLLTVTIFAMFHRYFGVFVRAQMGRTAEISVIDNLCPISMFGNQANRPLVKLGYVLFWVGTLGLMLYRQRRSSLTVQMIFTLPWMMAMPLEIFPYTGVLLLPVLLLRTRMITARGFFRHSDMVFLGGFLLVGFLHYPFATHFSWLIHSHRLPSAINSLGTTLVLCSLAWSEAEPEVPTSNLTLPSLRRGSKLNTSIRVAISE